MTKAAAQESLEKMPEEFPVEELIERLLFVQKVQEGLLQSERGETVPIDDIKNRLKKW